MQKEIYKNNNQENLYKGREGLVYARVSSKRQETEGSGLLSQEGRCVKELQSIGVPYVKTFQDSFSGGGDFMRRPAMRELLEYIDNNPHRDFVVVFDDLSRFARDVFFHIKLRAEFKKREVILKCLNYNFDESEEGEFAELIFAGKAELDRKQNRRQVIQKQKSRMELGYWAFASRRPYEMTKDPLHGNVLKLIYPEATWLKEAMEGFASGRFIRKIDACKFLLEKGYWDKQSPERYIDNFSLICKDPLFAGYIEYPQWEVARRIGHHEALISLETFNLIQKRLKNEGLGKRIRVDISEDFPLRGLSLCMHCSKPLTAAWSKGKIQRHPYYFCQNKECVYKAKSIRKKDIEDSFDKLLKKQKLGEGADLLIAKVFDSVWDEEILDLRNSQNVKTQNKRGLEENISKLTQLAVDSKNEKVREAYEKQIEKAMEEISNTEEGLIDNSNLDVPYRTALDKATLFLKSPYDVWQKVGVVEKHSLFYFVFDTKIPYDIKEGYRTDNIPSAVRLFSEFATANSCDVEMGGIEPPCK